LPVPTHDHQVDDPTALPATDTEVALAELWTSLLGVKQVGIHDDFFELGGHSLLAAQLVGRVRERLGVPLSIRTVFEESTIAALARQVEAARDDHHTRSSDGPVGPTTNAQISRRQPGEPQTL